MRRSEMLRLKWCDVDLENGFVTLHDTKNGENRRVPLTKRCIQVLEQVPKVDATVLSHLYLLFASHMEQSAQ